MPGHLTSVNESGCWRTPTIGMLNADRSRDPEYAQRKIAKGQTITLADQVKDRRMWPTPMRPNGGRSVKHVTDWASDRTAYHNGKKVQVDLKAAVGGGKLNPTWVEWLMGWPLGWTDCLPSETVKSHRSWPWYSAFFTNGCQSA